MWVHSEQANPYSHITNSIYVLQHSACMYDDNGKMQKKNQEYGYFLQGAFNIV